MKQKIDNAIIEILELINKPIVFIEDDGVMRANDFPNNYRVIAKAAGSNYPLIPHQEKAAEILEQLINLKRSD